MLLTRQGFHLSDQQIEFFDQNGHLILRNCVPAELFHKLQDATLRMISRGKAAGLVHSPGTYCSAGSAK